MKALLLLALCLAGCSPKQVAPVESVARPTLHVFACYTDMLARPDTVIGTEVSTTRGGSLAIWAGDDCVWVPGGQVADSIVELPCHAVLYSLAGIDRKIARDRVVLDSLLKRGCP